jgi:hypothetical protein
MIEQLLTTGSKAIYIGNSGPGPKALLSGDQNLGYFGEVTDTQLFGISQVAGAGGMYQGTDHPDLVPGANHWLKFIWNGKVIFIAKRPFRSNVSWADLYAAGMVYGTRDNGKYPLATPKHQFIQMPKYEGEKLWVLKPRLVRGYAADPVAPANVGDYTGEWSQLLGRCSISLDGNITPKFATMSYNALGWSQSSPDSVTMETMSNNVNQCNVRGDGASGVIMGAYRTILKTDRVSGISGHYWRPVLELIPDTEAKDPYTLLYRTPGPFAPVINDVRQWTGSPAQKPAAPRQKTWPYQLPNPTYSFVNQALKPSAPRGTAESPGLKAFTITGSYVA